MSSRPLASVAVAALVVASLGVAGCHCQTARQERAHRRGAKARAAASAGAADDQSQTIAGLRFLELVTGGAAAGDKLPLVVFFHAHGGRPEALRARFAAFPVKARVILPYGLHRGDKGGYEWFHGAQFTPEGQRAYAEALPSVEAQVSAGLLAIAEARPTLGKPIAGGFSRGAGITLALALWHPALLGAACPMAGELPLEVFTGVGAPATKPEVHAFIGDSDPYTPNADRTIGGFESLGYVADLKVLAGFGHTFDPGAAEVLGCLERAARAVR